MTWDDDIANNTALARTMMRVYGEDAAAKARANASNQTVYGDEAAAERWRRVTDLIGILAERDQGKVC